MTVAVTIHLLGGGSVNSVAAAKSPGLGCRLTQSMLYGMGHTQLMIIMTKAPLCDGQPSQHSTAQHSRTHCVKTLRVMVMSLLPLT